MNDSFTEEEMDELDELQNQQWWAQLDKDAMAVEEFLLLSKQEKWWERWWRKTKEEAHRWI